MPKTPSRPLTIPEAADRTGINRRTLNHAITMGWLKADKLPGLTGPFLINPDDLDRFAAARRKKAAS